MDDSLGKAIELFNEGRFSDFQDALDAFTSTTRAPSERAFYTVLKNLAEALLQLGDGDLVDTLVDALSPLAENGVVWLLTPKAGRDGHVEPSEITESAPTAGLQQTSTMSVGKDWGGARLVAPRAAQKKR